MSRKKYASIPSYYREGHTVQAHRRQLSDVAYLELAEGPEDNIQDVEFLLIPDPLNKRAPIYVREDVLYTISNADFRRLTDFSKGWNPSDKIRRISTRRTVNRRASGLSDEGSSVDWGEVVSIVDQVLDLFDSGSGSGSGSSTPTDPGTYVSPSGFVYCVRNIGGQDVGFGLNPSGRSLIAFSSPAEVKKMFSNLPPNMGGTLPYIQLPSVVPGGLVALALRNPNKIVRIKPGTRDVFEVVGPVTGSGSDNFGNPTPGNTNPDPYNEDPDTPGSSSGASFGSLLPLALIGGLLTLGK